MAKKYNMIIFEAGGECRRLATEDSEIGHKVKSIVNSGNLVPSNVIMEILDSFLSKTLAEQNVIFDGIPLIHSYDLFLEKK
jgi:adenylate kinase family enzyme